jgi:hypothetical protein
MDPARACGRDADALEVTRWGAIEMSAEDVAAQAADGVTRLVVAAASLDPRNSATSSPPSPSATVSASA